MVAHPSEQGMDVSEDVTWRRGHWVRKPQPSAKRMSPWLVILVVAAAAWLWTQGGTPATPAPQPQNGPSVTAPAQAGR